MHWNIAPKSSVGRCEMWVQIDCTVNLKPKNQNGKYHRNRHPVCTHVKITQAKNPWVQQTEKEHMRLHIRDSEKAEVHVICT